jgi:hypothetical protein
MLRRIERGYPGSRPEGRALAATHTLAQAGGCFANRCPPRAAPAQGPGRKTKGRWPSCAIG